MNSINNLLQFITIEDSKIDYLQITNADDKFWVFPKRNISIALNLYQPSSIKGKLLKKGLPYFKNHKIVQKRLGITEINYSLEKNLNKILTSIFKTNNIEFAIFGGTPSKHQKITIQIFKGNSILGYCKVTHNKEVEALFCHEEKVLTALYKMGIRQIPICLYNGKLNNDVAVFVQSTLKTNQSKIIHNWQEVHWDFLRSLHDKTKKTIPFQETDFYNTIELLKNNLKTLEASNRKIITEAIVKVSQFYENNKFSYSAYHADFTPWNMFVEKKQLFVFDFEYAKMSYPPFLDWFHFFTQTCIFEKGLNADKIFEAYQFKKNNISKYFNDPDFYYVCYLLDVVSLYVNRDKGSYSKDVERNLSIWIKLIARL
jgi:hypothetical protein